jgi:hypothetical protein
MTYAQRLDDFNAELDYIYRFVDDAQARRSNPKPAATAYEAELDAFNAELDGYRQFAADASARRFQP